MSRIKKINKETFITQKSNIHAANKKFEMLKQGLAGIVRGSSKEKGNMTSRESYGQEQRKIVPTRRNSVFRDDK